MKNNEKIKRKVHEKIFERNYCHNKDYVMLFSIFIEKLAKGESEVRTAEDEEKDVGSDNKNEKEEDAIEEQEYVTDIAENLSEKKFKIPSYKYCRQNQVSIGKLHLST